MSKSASFYSSLKSIQDSHWFDNDGHFMQLNYRNHKGGGFCSFEIILNSTNSLTPITISGAYDDSINAGVLAVNSHEWENPSNNSLRFSYDELLYTMQNLFYSFT